MIDPWIKQRAGDVRRAIESKDLGLPGYVDQLCQSLGGQPAYNLRAQDGSPMPLSLHMLYLQVLMIEYPST